MSALGWILAVAAGWMLLSVGAALLIGPVLAGNAEYYPYEYYPEPEAVPVTGTDLLDRLDRWDNT